MTKYKIQMMSYLTLILGGARSGKSACAVKIAASGKRVVFIATCIPQDKEMAERVKLHKKTRPNFWKVIEEGYDMVSALTKARRMNCQVILIDCLGLLISNLMHRHKEDKKIEKEIELTLQQIKKVRAKVIVVSNEVGMGIVPDNPLSRRFRDLLGRANQRLAEEADRVILMCAGVALTIKGDDV
jgi:adenosylcobinamide kinase/adenosylcobinamide-phosphate guanylyltransferase